jgi:hypothetical protein
MPEFVHEDEDAEHEHERENTCNKWPLNGREVRDR